MFSPNISLARSSISPTMSAYCLRRKPFGVSPKSAKRDHLLDRISAVHFHADIDVHVPICAVKLKFDFLDTFNARILVDRFDDRKARTIFVKRLRKDVCVVQTVQCVQKPFALVRRQHALNALRFFFLAFDHHKIAFFDHKIATLNFQRLHIFTFPTTTASSSRCLSVLDPSKAVSTNTINTLSPRSIVMCSSTSAP